MSTVAPLTGTARSNGQIDTEVMTGLAALDVSVSELEATAHLSTAVALAELRRLAADKIAKLNRRDPQRAVVGEALKVLRRCVTIGALDLPLADEDRERLACWEKEGWPGLVASMLLTTAWRWSATPVLSKVPDWLWADYTEWLFAAPNPLITSEDCAIYAAHVERHTAELARWAQRNMGSPSVKAAVDVFARLSPLHALRYTDANSRIAAESRAKIFGRVHGKAVEPFEPVVMSRCGRALRVGFVARSWDIQPDTCAMLAQFEQIPAHRVERILFSLTEPATAFGWYCRDKAQEFHVLPPDLAGQVVMLREMSLDVAVFAGDLLQTDNFSHVPLFRVAPLQVVHDQARGATGLSEVDLQIVPASSAAVGANRFSEKIGVLPVGGSAFALRRGGDAELVYSREDLGFPADAVIVLAVLPSVHGAGEQLAAFARILAEAPQARLVLHVLPSGDRPRLGTERFCAIVEAVMKQSGIASDRIAILAPEQATYDETRAIVRLADIHLSLPGADIWAAEALSCGVVVVAQRGLPVEWLNAEGLAELVAADAEDMVALVAALVTDSLRRASLKARLDESLKNGLCCADTLAAADAFLGIVESACDQLETQGRAIFLRDRRPMITGAATDVEPLAEVATGALAGGDVSTAVDAAQKALAMRPRDGKLRALYGRALLADGRPDRASVYLLAAVEQAHEDANLWFDLATSLRSEGKCPEASQALESVLRLDPRRANGWLMLIELAESAGATDLARDAYNTLKELQPDHPQLASLAFRFES